MQLMNTKDGYGWIAIVLHWVAAVAVITMLVIGFRADMLGDAGDRAGRSELMGWHLGLGAIFLLVLLARVVSSWVQTRPEPVQQAKPLMTLAAATHQLLLIAILIQIFSGPLAVWSGGRAIDVFGLFSIPTPFAERNEGAHEFAELLHAVGRWGFIVLISLHVLGVLKHQLIDKRNLLRRMLAPPARG